MKTINTIAYDVQTATHANDSASIDWMLLADAKRLGGIASKEFRSSYLVGAIAGIIKGPLDAGAELLSKKAPLLKDADPEKKSARRAKVRSGEVVERTQAEQNVYLAAIKRLSRFCAAHSITPANKKRGKPGSNKGETDAKAEAKADATPTANNAATADKHIRMQAASLMAYAEKNRALIPDAIRFALAELSEALRAIPPQE